MRIMEHLDYFKMRSIDPRTTHTFFYYEELQWRANFLDNLLEVLYSSDMIEAISRAALSELVAGLLTYLHKLAKVNPSIMSTLPGKVILEKDSPYFGRLFF